MDRDTIAIEDIFREVREELERLPETGKVELTIYKAKHVLANYDIRPTKTRHARITLNSAE